MSCCTSSVLPPTSNIEDAGMRCIAHIDMDCFYAQVEAVRLGIDCRTTPLVLSQWDCLIAVNYPARAYGIKRGLHNTLEAQALCPDLVVALSPSYRMGEAVSQYHPHPTRDLYKISLEPYRLASRKIFAILASEPGVQVEKGSVDEAYVDVTEAAQRELAELQRAAAAAGRVLDPLVDVLAPSTRLIEDRRAAMAEWFAARGTSLAAVFDAPMAALLRGECGAAVGGSRGFCVSADDAAYGARCALLCAASRVVLRLRQRVYAELHYDCSAGIAHNRVLAKCISATHKPNQQTLLLPDRSASALFDLPLVELRGFGGKFGAAVSAVCGGATECRELWLAPLSQLYALNHSSFTAGDDDDDEVEGGEGDGPSGQKQNKNNSTTTTTTHGSSGGGSLRKKNAKTEGEAEAPTVGEYTYFRIRGVHGDAVTDPALPRAMEASKIFHPSCTSWSAARLWMAPLAGELWHRFQHYEDRYSKEGRSLVVYLRTYASPEDVRYGWRSQSYRRHTALPSHIDGAALLANMGLRELEKLMREVTQVEIKASNIEFKPHRTSSRDESQDRDEPASTSAPTLPANITTLAVAGVLAGNNNNNNNSSESHEKKEGDVHTIPGVSAEDDRAVPMPPLRILGLSIIGLRPCGGGGGGGAGEAAEAPQRSLKDMFANLSAVAAKSETASAATALQTTKKTSTSTVSETGPTSTTTTTTTITAIDSDRSSAAGALPGRVEAAVTSPLPVVEIESDVDGGSDDDVHGEDEGIGRRSREKHRAPGKRSRDSSKKTNGHTQSAPVRRTLADFFHSPPQPLSSEKSKSTQISTSAVAEDEKRKENVGTDDAQGMLRQRRPSSTSVIEVSSDECEDAIE